MKKLDKDIAKAVVTDKFNRFFYGSMVIVALFMVALALGFGNWWYLLAAVFPVTLLLGCFAIDYGAVWEAVERQKQSRRRSGL